MQIFFNQGNKRIEVEVEGKGRRETKTVFVDGKKLQDSSDENILKLGRTLFPLNMYLLEAVSRSQSKEDSTSDCFSLGIIRYCRKNWYPEDEQKRRDLNTHKAHSWLHETGINRRVCNCSF